MATSERAGVSITLLDNTVIDCQPLKISLLREFLKEFAKMDVEGIAEDNEASMDILMECTFIALKQYSPGLVKTSKELEEFVDLPRVYEIIEVASGVRLQDAAALLGTVISST